MTLHKIDGRSLAFKRCATSLTVYDDAENCSQAARNAAPAAACGLFR